MNKFRVGDVVRLTSEAREDYRKTFNIAGDEYYARTFVEMVKKGTKATVSSVDTEGVWLENNQFWIPQDVAVLACQAVAIETHSTLEGTSVEVKHKAEEEDDILKGKYLINKLSGIVYEMSMHDEKVRFSVVAGFNGSTKPVYDYSIAKAKEIIGEGGWVWADNFPDEGEEVAEQHDSVTNPKHYHLLEGVEVIDIQDALGKKIDASGLLNANECSYYMQMVGYGLRFMDKNGVEDLKKMRWYLDRLIKSMEVRNERKS